MKKLKRTIWAFIYVILVLIIFSCHKKNKDNAHLDVSETLVEDIKDEVLETTETTAIREYLTIPIGNYQDRQSERASMEVSFDNQIYYFEISWANSAFENVKWNFSGKFDIYSNGVLYNNSRCAIITYDMNDSSKDPVETEVYEDGTGLMKLDKSLLCWKDDQEVPNNNYEYNAIFERIVSGQTNTFPNSNSNYFYPNNAQNYTPYTPVDPNYNQYNYNPYNQYDPYQQNGMSSIPTNSYYYIIGYDRNVTMYSNGVPMASRVPVFGGNYYYPTQIANRLVYSAYVSISNWCNSNLMGKNNIEDFYLNFATIESETPSNIIIIVNCSYKKNERINGYSEFRVSLDLSTNRYTWRRITENGNTIKEYNYYDEDDDEIYDYDGRKIIIIK